MQMTSSIFDLTIADSSSRGEVVEYRQKSSLKSAHPKCISGMGSCSYTRTSQYKEISSIGGGGRDRSEEERGLQFEHNAIRCCVDCMYIQILYTHPDTCMCVNMINDPK